MYFMIKDDEVWEKYEQIWDVIKFRSEPVYDKTSLKAKVNIGYKNTNV